MKFIPTRVCPSELFFFYMEPWKADGFPVKIGIPHIRSLEINTTLYLDVLRTLYDINFLLTWQLHYGESDPLRKLIFNDHYPSALYGILIG